MTKIILKHSWIACCIGIGMSMIASVSEAQTLDKAVADLRSHYDGFLPWMGGLWDPATGGQRQFANSASTDMQSTGQFTSILQTAGLLDTMPMPVRTKLVDYFQSRQDPTDGFFYDFAGQSLSDRDRGRYLGYAIGALSRLGAAPLYTLPTDDTVPDHLKSASAYTTWMAGQAWDTPWNAGDRIQSQRATINGLDEPLRTELFDAQFNFLPTKQNTGTGYWGNSSTSRDYNYLSGGAKVSSGYFAQGLAVPHADELLDSMFWTLHNEDATQATHVRNVLWLYRNLESSLSRSLTEQERVELVQATSDNIEQFLNNDGAFGMSFAAASDMNAASQARFALNWGVTLVAGEPISTPWPESDAFWDQPVFQIGYAPNLDAPGRVFLTATADTYVQQGDSGTNFGLENRLRVKNTPSSTTERIAFIGFSIESLTEDLSGAALHLSSIATPVGTSAFRIYGILGSEGDGNFDQTSLTFANSTHTESTGDSNDPSVDGFDENSLLTYLGLINVVDGDDLIFGSTALDDFLKEALLLNETQVSFAIVRDTVNGQTTHIFASIEHDSVLGPQLSVVIPEPASFMLLGLGGLYLLTPER